MTQFDPENPAAVAQVLAAKGFKLPGPHIALVRAAAVTQSKGGIYIPATSQKMARKGVVVMKGPLVTRDIEVGDGALLQLYEATKVVATVGTTDVALEILHQDDVLMTFPGSLDGGAAFVPEKLDPMELGGARLAAVLAAGTVAGLWLVDRAFTLVNSRSDLGVLVGTVSLAVMAVAWTQLAKMLVTSFKKKEKRDASSTVNPGAGGTHD